MYKTKNVTPHLRVALLVPDAHKNATLAEVKIYFAKWEDSVMTFLYAVMFKEEEEEETAENDKTPLTNTDKDMQVMQATKAAMAADMEKFKRELEKEKERYKEEAERENAKINAVTNKKYEELSIITELVIDLRRHSKRVSALSSRAVSPS